MYLREDRNIRIDLLLNNSLGGDHKKRFLGPLVNPIKLCLLRNCRVEDYGLLEVIDHRVEQQNDVEVLIEIIDE